MADWTGKIFRISQQKSSKIHVKSRFTAKIAKCGSFIILTS
jgi:GTP-dependent phosphoenolpyruvate carboxykinase